MNRHATAAPPRRGRPRSEKARGAILDASAELLLERGLAAVSMDAVAARAEVSKATIYRWWPTKETLALDALYREWASVPPPEDTGSLRGDLRSLARPWVRRASMRPYGRVIAALLTEAQTDPVFAREYRARFLQPRRDQARAVFRRAIARGEIAPDTNVEVALDVVFGPVYHRLLHGHAPLDERFVTDVIDTALGGIFAGSESGTGPAAGHPDGAHLHDEQQAHDERGDDLGGGLPAVPGVAVAQRREDHEEQRGDRRVHDQAHPLGHEVVVPDPEVDRDARVGR
jgi:AcrR family transcriptional regulator